MSGSLMKELDLLSIEHKDDFLRLDSITTATVYSGSPPVDLKSRINAIAELNPWLLGRLVKKDKKISLQYPDQSGGPVPVDFMVLDNLNFTAPSYNPVDHNSQFEQYFVDKGIACLNKDKPLFRVIVAILHSDQFVLFVSMSHAVADGNTYYNIYNMISADASPRSLIMKRNEACSVVIRSINREETDFFRSGGFIMNAVGKILCHGKHHMAYCKVRPEWIEAQKVLYQQRKEKKKSGMEKPEQEQEQEQEVTSRLHDGGEASLPPLTFVSTNDILTSAVFKALHADYGLMAVNFRNRVEGLTTDHCGNYEIVVGYSKEDFQQPEGIRASLAQRTGAPDVLPVSDSVHSACVPPSCVSPAELAALGKKTNALLCGQYRRQRIDKPILPSFCARRKAMICVVTNWSGFYEQITMEGCEHLNHFPVFSSSMPAVMPGAVIYKSNKDTMNIMAVQGKPIFVDALVKLGAVDCLF